MCGIKLCKRTHDNAVTSPLLFQVQHICIGRNAGHGSVSMQRSTIVQLCYSSGLYTGVFRHMPVSAAALAVPSLQRGNIPDMRSEEVL